MAAPSRLVRVFISSTFRDFIAERDLLVKQVFPELRRRCRDRFVEVLEIDLRWGITEEQSRSGETLRICLEEIDRCRPSAPVFFVGLLGERYGWIPPADYFRPEVLENPQLSWVRDHIGACSVTELEILHGVLRNEAMRDKAFFYHRRGGYQERHWAGIELHHAGLSPPIRPEDFTNDLAADPAAAAAKQRDLQQRVREVSLRWDPRDYDTPAELADLVLADLWGAIDQVFPASSVPDSLEQESLEHRVFMANRQRAYVPRAGLFAQLDVFAGVNLAEDEPSPASAGEPRRREEQIEDDDEAAGEEEELGTLPEPPAVCVVLGESGSGKSALLAAWLERREAVFYHFTGATAGSVSAAPLLQRLLATLRRRGVVPMSRPIPNDAEAMREVLPDWLELLSARGGGLLLFDAVNQLATARDRELWWWPQSWPANIRVVFSTLPGDALRAMERRGWLTHGIRLQVPLLDPAERAGIMEAYLRRVARDLDPPLKARIVAAPPAANPLYLLTLLDELRLRSRHEDLAWNLEGMLACPDPGALFGYVLRKLERDFTHPDRPGLVRRALGLLGAAGRGLSENELLQLLSPAPKPVVTPLPRHYWAALYLALEESLVNREGQLSFFHDYLRQAVWRECLDEAHERDAAHARLAAPVLRWAEAAAFGPSMRVYGFTHGIRHLLAADRLAEGIDLLLDPAYRETAVIALHSPEPILEDVDRLRHARACAAVTTTDPAPAVALTVLALTARPQLTHALRHRLDQAAAAADWETVVVLAGAEPREGTRLLLAARALHQRKPSPAEPATQELRALLARWVADSGELAWTAWLDLVLPPSGPAALLALPSPPA